MGLLLKADELLKKQVSRKGLLKCSLQLADRKTADRQSLSVDEHTRNLEALFADFSQNIETIHSDTDVINYIAASFIKYLNIRQLACLMFNPVDDRFSSWISIGFTANHGQQLFFPRQVISDLFKTYVLQDLSGAQLESLKPYFSPADYPGLRRIALIPFAYQEMLLGFILIANLSPLFSQNYKFREIFYNYAVINKFMRERSGKMVDIRGYDYQTRAEMAAGMLKQLEYSLQHKTLFKLISLYLDEAIAPVMEDDPKLNSLILKEDLLLLLGQLFKHIGRMYNMRDGHLLFVINKLHKFDLAVLKDQLNKTLKHYFMEILIEENFKLNFKIFTYPEDGDSPEALLAAYDTPDTIQA